MLDAIPIGDADRVYPDPQRIEFVVFRDRLAAAMWTARQTSERVIRPAIADLERFELDGSAELKQAVEESRGVLDDAGRIQLGACIVVVTAAFEVLLGDLIDGEPPKQLWARWRTLALAHGWQLDGNVPREKLRDPVWRELALLRDARNEFAHHLIGSYWDSGRSTVVPITWEECDKFFVAAGRAATLLEERLELSA